MNWISIFESVDYHLSGYYDWLRSGRRAWARDLAWQLYTWLRRLDGYDRRLGPRARRLMWLCHYWHNGYTLAEAEAAVTDVFGAAENIESTDSFVLSQDIEVAT